MSADKSINHKITHIIHAAGLTDIPYSAYFSFFISFIFKMLKCSHVLRSNVFRMFFVVCVLILVFSRHDSPHRLPRPLARSSPPLCLMSSMASLYVLSGVLFLDVVGQASCSRPFLVVAVYGRPPHEVFAGSSISCLYQAQNVFVADGRGESSHIPPNPSSQLPPAGYRWLDRDRTLLLFSLTVVPAVFGGCQTASGGSPSSTGFEAGADKAADPSASTLLLLATELATTLLLAVLGFPCKRLIVLLDHAKKDVGR